MGYSILCHEGRELIAIYRYLPSYSRSKVQGDNVTCQIASDADSQRNFTLNGRLTDCTGRLSGPQGPDLRPINDNSAVFAISRDLGTIQATKDPVVWAIGYTTDPVINYTDLSGAPPTPRSPYYKIRYSTDADLVSFGTNCWEDYMLNIKGQIVDFLNDFSAASSRAQQQDINILHDADSVTYLLGGSVIIPAIHEVFGSMQLTIGTDAHGNLNTSDVMIFMKNIGGSKAK